MPTPELPGLVGDGSLVVTDLGPQGPFTFGNGVPLPQGPVQTAVLPPSPTPTAGINFFIPVLNDSAPSTPVALEVESAAYSPVGDVYGRARVLGRLLKIKVNNRYVSLAYLFCVGEVEEVEELIIDGRSATVSGNSGGAKFTSADLLLDTSAGGRTLYCQIFEGTSGQDVSTFWTNTDGGWTARDSAQTDTWANYCIVCFDLSADLSDFRAIPRVEAIIKGHKVRDPRTSPETTAYSNNAALVLAHFFENYVDSTKTVDDTTLGEAADWADEVMPNGAARRTLNTWLNKRQTVENIGSSMATWCGIYVSSDEDTFYFIPDKPRDSDLDIGPSKVVSSSAKRRSDSERPDDVRVIGFDVDNNREYIAEAVGSGSKITELRIPGITNYAEAKRYAIQHYNHATTEDLDISCKVHGLGLKLLRGNVVRFTSEALSIEDKAMRVAEVQFDGEDGYFTLRLVEYQEASYSDDVSTDPITTDLTLPDPYDVPAITGLVGSYGADTLSNGSGDVRGFITATWDTITYLFADRVQVRIFGYLATASPTDTELETFETTAGTTTLKCVIDTYIGDYFDGTVGSSGKSNFKIQARIISTSGAAGPWTDLPTVTTDDEWVNYKDPTPPRPDQVNGESYSLGGSPEYFGVRLTLLGEIPNHVAYNYITETGGSGGDPSSGNFSSDLDPYVQYYDQDLSFTEDTDGYRSGTEYSFDVQYGNRTGQLGTVRGTSITP